MRYSLQITVGGEVLWFFLSRKNTLVNPGKLSRKARGIGEHIFDIDAVAFLGIVNHDVGDGADELAVLDDGTAAHALDNAAGEGGETFVRDFKDEALVGGVAFV